VTGSDASAGVPLPGRGGAEEDAFVAELHEAPPEVIDAAVREAIRERRPRLAARLVGLLGDGVDADDPELSRALRVAEMLCLKGKDAVVEADLDDILDRLRERRRARFKLRHDTRRGNKKRPKWWSRYRR